MPACCGSWTHWPGTRDWVTEWLPVLDRPGPLDEEELTHFVSYREAIATSDGLLGDQETEADYQPITEWLLGFLKSPNEPELMMGPAQDKLAVLDSLHFQGGTAEHQDRLLETFVETPIVTKTLAPDSPWFWGIRGPARRPSFVAWSRGPINSPW